MSLEDFTRIAKKTRLSRLCSDAARLVLVEGETLKGAQKISGVKHRQQIQNAIKAIRRAATAGDVCVVCKRPVMLSTTPQHSQEEPECH